MSVSSGREPGVRSASPIGLDLPSGEDFTPESARFIACLAFSDRAQRRLDDLLEKNREGRLGPNEGAVLEQYIKANTRLATLQSKARLFLKRSGFEP